jgi:uncharacterized protein (DUF433 family)
MTLLDRITIEPGKCGGKPCIRGIRIRVTDVLELLAQGVTPQEVVEQYPYLELDDVYASIEYASRQLELAHRKTS